MNENKSGTEVIKAAIEVHKELGTGLLETVYEVALSYLLVERGYPNRRQMQSYLKLAKLKRGDPLNFGEGLMNDGMVRVVNGGQEK